MDSPNASLPALTAQSGSPIPLATGSAASHSDGKIAYVKLPHSDSGPAGITSGPDGNLWFTEHSGNRIGRLSTTGTLTEIESAQWCRSRGNRHRQRRQPVVRRGQSESHRAREPVRQRQGIRNPGPRQPPRDDDARRRRRRLVHPAAGEQDRQNHAHRLHHRVLIARGRRAARNRDGIRQKSLGHGDSRATDLSRNAEGRFHGVPDAGKFDGDVHHGRSRRHALVHRAQRQGRQNFDCGRRQGVRLLHSSSTKSTTSAPG